MPVKNKYEKLLDKQIAKVVREITAIYDKAIKEISFATYLQYRNFKGTTFSLDTHPLLKKALDKLTKGMSEDIVKVIKKAIEDSWNLANSNNDQIASEIINRVFPELAPVVFNPNHDALKAFTNRVEKGMNLSKRVWKYTKAYRYELEAGLTDGINKGMSASKMATNLKRYLNEPEKLFRRVRDENGKLQLSRAARNYHPGQGVYRSSYQNALRLTGSETNLAYKLADHNRWKDATYIKGIEVKVSNNHPVKDQCDHLAGKYPKDYAFVPFHPRCRCFAIPILVSDEEFSKQEDVLLGISKKMPKIKEVEKIPQKATDWWEANNEKIKGWKNKPYPILYNPKYLGKYG